MMKSAQTQSECKPQPEQGETSFISNSFAAAKMTNEKNDDLASPTDKLIAAFSDWYKLRNAVATIVKFGYWLKSRDMTCKQVTVDDLQQAETSIIRYV